MSPRVGGGGVGVVAGAAGTVSDADLPLSMVLERAANAELEELLRNAARAKSELDAVIAAGAGVAAKRSARDLGYSGWAQSTGDRTAVNLVQRLTGSTKSEAFRQVRLGEAMGEADAATHPTGLGSGTGPGSGPGVDGSDEPLVDLDGNILVDPDADPEADKDRAAVSVLRPVPVVPWHEPISRAAREGVIRSEAVTIIMRGLGVPNERVDVEMLRAAAVELIADAAGVNADELGARARHLRDRIDPAGVQLRWDERFANRKWRFGRNDDGTKTAYVAFDEEGAAWVESIVGAALRPRRGGPRMVDPVEAERAEKLRVDERSNDQIVYDILMGAMRTGVQADPTATYGSRQPGIRVVITEPNLDNRTTDSDGTDGEGAEHLVGTGYLEDSKDAVPGSVIEKQICISGISPILMDTSGTILDVGREQRLHTRKQRVAMAVRDGGCRIEGCECPPSMTEAHHINEWVAHEGCTDLADGILLCPYHHTLVHTFGYRVVRIEGEYYLIPPPGENGERIPIRMPSKSPLEKERLRLAGIKAATDAADAAARAAAAGRGSAGAGVAGGGGDRAVRPGGQGPGESSAHLPTQHTRTA
ncbi:DUF222 domain-containing protein [Mycetocola zhujimingii]|uniref:DUF222 domain-containing protein n=1 Tax=Mycetocola zhujimingii TaxID=2079792 RepID=UPI0013C51139|nr:DUF222 domain-containing protein [Mycetocola zhujimingii]